MKLNGARQWIDLGFTLFQPSELAKIVFALWGAHVLALRERYLTTTSLLVPVLPVFGVLSLLIIAPTEAENGAVAMLATRVVSLVISCSDRRLICRSRSARLSAAADMRF